MSNNSLNIQIFGESHAEKIGVVVEGFPAGVRVDLEALRAFLSRRAPGKGDWATPRKEADLPHFISGIEIAGETEGTLTGEVFEAAIYNTNIRPQDYTNVQTVPRPGHADYGSWVKYGRIPTGGGKWSGRMTAPLCIAGGICKQLLEAKGIEIKAHISRIADVCDEPITSESEVGKIFPTVSEEAADKMKAVIDEARGRADSVGGDIGCIITGVKEGLGDALFDGIEGEIARMAFAIPAVKGIEFGTTRDYGSENNDAFIIKDGRVATATNNCGGILGGIATGMPIEFKVRIKPTPSIGIEQRSINLETMEEASITVNGRHDPCILPRAVPVVEAAAAIAIYNLLKEANNGY